MQVQKIVNRPCPRKQSIKHYKFYSDARYIDTSLYRIADGALLVEDISANEPIAEPRRKPA